MGLGISRHKLAAHDLSLMVLLLAHHEAMISFAYDPAIQGRNPLANQARTALQQLQELKKLLQKAAEEEHPKSDFLKYYEEEYTGSAWPPRITEKEE